MIKCIVVKLNANFLLHKLLTASKLNIMLARDSNYMLNEVLKILFFETYNLMLKFLNPIPIT